jgi:hypothetical protein
MLKTTTPRDELIERADRDVSMAWTVGRLGWNCPAPDSGTSVKVLCPFGFYHRDGGAETSFRVYADPNDAWCFAGCGYFRPSSFAAAVWDCSRAEAAQRLLEMANPPAPAPGEEPGGAVNLPSLAAALRVFCGRLPEYVLSEFNADTLIWMDRVLARLSDVVDEQTAEAWLGRAKEAAQRRWGTPRPRGSE